MSVRQIMFHMGFESTTSWLTTNYSTKGSNRYYALSQLDCSPMSPISCITSYVLYSTTILRSDSIQLTINNL